MLNLFNTMREEQQTLMNLHTFENFIERLHRKEIIDGQIRQVLYEIIYNLDENSDNDSPINYKIVLDSKINSHRTSKSRTALDCIIHCRCGSVHDEISIVQCYACQVRFRFFACKYIELFGSVKAYPVRIPKLNCILRTSHNFSSHSLRRYSLFLLAYWQLSFYRILN